MLNADINIGKACNNRCRFCSNENPTSLERRWARPEQVREEVERNWEQGARSIGFLGGEPCLYPHLESVISHARNIGYERISICTNGQLLADRQLLERLLESGLTRVALSIHSHTARVEDYITQRAGSFGAKIEALKNLVRARDTGLLPDGLSLNTVLKRKNVDALLEFVSYMKGLGVDNIRFNFIRPSLMASGSRIWVPPVDRVREAIGPLVALNEKKLLMQMNFADIPLCKLPWQLVADKRLFEKYVGENWDLVTEVSHTAPYLSKDGREEIFRFNWQKRRQGFKLHPSCCSDCAAMAGCEGIWKGYVRIYGEREFIGCPAQISAALAGAGGAARKVLR